MAVYPKALERAAGAGLDLLNADVRAILIDEADYTYSAAHEFLSSVPGAARVASSAALAGKSIGNGVFDANDVTLSNVTGDQSEAILVYIHTGDDATARLLAYIDSGSGLPYTPNGGDINIVWNVSGIFAL